MAEVDEVRAVRELEAQAAAARHDVTAGAPGWEGDFQLDGSHLITGVYRGEAH